MGLEIVGVFGHQTGADDWQPSIEGAARHFGAGKECFLDADLQEPWVVRKVRALRSDIMVSLYYRDLVPDQVLAQARLGGINLHGSLLPAYRGRAPVNWMVLRGETEGGATLHVMTRKPDAGPILAQRSFPICERDTAFDVLLNVKTHGLDLLEEYLPKYLRGRIATVPQGRGTYFGRRRPEDGQIDWNLPADAIYNLIRAVTRPYPGAFSLHDGRRLNVWWAEKEPAILLPPGLLRTDGKTILAGTGTHALRLVDFA